MQKLSFVSFKWSSCGGLFWTQECKHELQPPRDTWQRGDILSPLPLLVFLGPGVLRAPLRAASRMESHSNNFNFWTIWELFIFYITASFVHLNCFICISEWRTHFPLTSRVYLQLQVEIFNNAFQQHSRIHLNRWKVRLQKYDAMTCQYICCATSPLAGQNKFVRVSLWVIDGISYYFQNFNKPINQSIHGENYQQIHL